MGYKAYPDYKESEIEWLGLVPTHWPLMHLSHVARMQSGENITSLTIEPTGSYPVYGGNGIRGYCEEFTHSGDFALIGRQGALCGNVNYAQGRFWASEHAVVVTPDRTLILRWLGELLRAMNLNQYSVSAAQPGLSVEMLGRLKIPFPPLEEQQKIANFLDHKTAQIDRLIEKKQELIENLQEQRIAVITHAVTKGLDGNVPMKDSGVERLGKVPSHWKVLRLKDALVFQRGHDLPADSREDGSVPLVSSAGISATHSQAKGVAPGIVTGRYGTIGNFTYLEEDFWPLNTTLYTIDIKSNNAKFLWNMLQSMTPIFILNSKKSAVPGIDRNDLHPESTVIPPPEEQDEIAKYLDKISERLDAQLNAIQLTVDLYQEYRTALITAAVTGQIDVRDWQAPAAAEAPELDMEVA